MSKTDAPDRVISNHAQDDLMPMPVIDEVSGS
jgi:hypothetical protein